MASKSLRRTLMKLFSINESDSAAAVVSNFTIAADNANRAHIEQAIQKMGPGNLVEFIGDDRVKYTGPNPEKAEKELATLGLQKIDESDEDEEDKLSFDPETGKNLDDIEEDDDENSGDDDSNLTDEEKAEKQRLAEEAQKKIEEDNTSGDDDEDDTDDDEDMSIIAESLKPAARRVRNQITSPRAKDKIK